VLFASGADVVVRSSADRGRLETGLATAATGPGATRFAPALKLAASLLAESALPRREIILISDFQRRGWEQTPGRDDVKLPERTVLTPINVASGEASNLSVTPFAVATLGRELRSGSYDVVHVHEPNAPAVSWYAVEAARSPVVGTFHCYSTSSLANNVAALAGARRLYNKLHVRVAVSEAARWTARRFYGGRYRVVPNGVDLTAARPREGVPADGPLRLLFLLRYQLLFQNQPQYRFLVEGRERLFIIPVKVLYLKDMI
jgi:glycosyltransferase involved in cell wall biosynthesis